MASTCQLDPDGVRLAQQFRGAAEIAVNVAHVRPREQQFRSFLRMDRRLGQTLVESLQVGIGQLGGKHGRQSHVSRHVRRPRCERGAKRRLCLRKLATLGVYLSEVDVRVGTARVESSRPVGNKRPPRCSGFLLSVRG